MRLFSRTLIIVLSLLIVLGALGAVKALQIKRMIDNEKAFVPQPQTVSTAQVGATAWETSISAVGSLKAEKGVMVTSELPGKITRIAIQSGANVKTGSLILQQDISTETAQLQVAQSQVDLTLKNLDRAHNLIKQKVITQSQFDELKASHEQATSQVALIRATIAKKTIRAPFAGRLGIRQVNLGEFIDSGQPVVSLQSIHQIYVNFQLPQQYLTKLEKGFVVRIGSDAIVDEHVEGRITAINPEVDNRTRNIAVQATLPNTDERLRPGMFVTVSVVLPDLQKVLTIPVSAVNYAPYSDSVFLVEAAGDGSNPENLLLRQQFVQLGEMRGDFIAVRDGLKAGQQIVSTGVFKLRNGQAVAVDNRLAPTFEPSPLPANA